MDQIGGKSTASGARPSSETLDPMGGWALPGEGLESLRPQVMNGIFPMPFRIRGTPNYESVHGAGTSVPAVCVWKTRAFLKE